MFKRAIDCQQKGAIDLVRKGSLTVWQKGAIDGQKGTIDCQAVRDH